MQKPTAGQVKELRIRSGLTQKAFAEKYGIPKRTVEKWESGESRMAGYLYDLLKDRINADRLYNRTACFRSLHLHRSSFLSETVT